MKFKHKSIRNSLLEILYIWQFGSGVDFEDIKNVTVRFLHSTLLVHVYILQKIYIFPIVL